MALQRTQFYRVLHRPRLFLGGEREPTLMMALVAVGLAVSGQNLVALIVAGIIWFGSIGLFRAMAKADPDMSRVYMRQLRYAGYYPARSRPYRGTETSSRGFYVLLTASLVGLFIWGAF